MKAKSPREGDIILQPIKRRLEGLIGGEFGDDVMVIGVEPFRPIRGNPKMCVCIACPFLLLKLKSPRPITSENGARNLRRQFRRHCLIARQSCTRHTRRLLASDPVLPRLPTKSSDVMAGCISYSGASATDLHRLPFLVCINQDLFI